MIIRPVVENDFDGLRLLEDQWCSGQWNRKQLKSEVHQPSSLALVIEMDQAIVASLFFRCCFPEAELLRITVSEQVRGKKLARGLLQKGLADLASKQIEICFLEVRESNLIAKKLYASFGFEQCGTRLKYYKDPVEDAIVMRLRLLRKSRRLF